jgi:hypothetical protein
MSTQDQKDRAERNLVAARDKMDRSPTSMNKEVYNSFFDDYVEVHGRNPQRLKKAVIKYTESEIQNAMDALMVAKVDSDDNGANQEFTDKFNSALNRYWQVTNDPRYNK